MSGDKSAEVDDLIRRLHDGDVEAPKKLLVCEYEYIRSTTARIAMAEITSPTDRHPLTSVENRTHVLVLRWLWSVFHEKHPELVGTVPTPEPLKRPLYETLNHQADFRAGVIRAARRVRKMYYRDRLVNATRFEPGDTTQHLHSLAHEEADDLEESKDVMDDLRRLLKSGDLNVLTPREFEFIKMRFIDGLTSSAISKILHLTEGQLSNMSRRIRSKLRDRYRGHTNGDFGSAPPGGEPT